MKALSIVALIFSSIAVFTPFVGVFVAIICSIFAVISFRSQPTLSGITLGINIISTAFFSPLLVSTALNLDDEKSELFSSFDTYFIYVGIHVVALIASVAWRLIRGPVENP